MTLWDFLDTCQCNQELYIYLVNDCGEYLPVYHGTKQDIDFWDDEVFDILQNKIEVFETLPDRSIQIEVRDFDFDKPMREQYTAYKDKWGYWEKHPDKAPWGYWTDTEAYCQMVRKKSRWFLRASGRRKSLTTSDKRKQRKRDMWQRHEQFAEYVERVRKKRRADND